MKQSFTKQILIVLFSVVLLAALAVFASAEATIIDSGYCGAYGNENNVTWTLDSEGTLTISGTGEIDSCSTDWYGGSSHTLAPWGIYESSIRIIVINEGITNISSGAFRGFSTLTNVIIPASVTSIDTDTGLSCPQLMSFDVDNENPFFCSEDGVLYNKEKTDLIRCPSTKISVMIPDGVKNIFDTAFYECKNLTNVNLPDSVVTIGRSAFSRCISLSNITIPKNVENFSRSSFANCDSLVSIDIVPDNQIFYSVDGVVYYKNRAELFFCPYAKTDVTIPNGITSIADEAFENCPFLTTVIIPNSITSIGVRAFADCNSLTNVTIPEGLTSIGEAAFRSCEKLSHITLPNGLERIPNEAFENDFLLDIEIPASVTSIGEDAFLLTKSIVVDEDNPAFASENGFLLNKEKTRLLACPIDVNATELVVPETVRIIGKHSLQTISYTDIVLGENVFLVESEGIWNPILNSITVRGFDTRFEKNAVALTHWRLKNIPKELQRDLLLALLGIIEMREELLPYSETDAFEEPNSYPVGTIRCHEGSSAQDYALYNGIDCELVHFYDILLSKTEPTETEPSYGTYECLYCEETEQRVYVESDEPHRHIPDAPVYENVIPATCKAMGSYVEVVRCIECGNIISSTPKGIDKLDHTPDTPTQEDVIPATCKAKGSYNEVVRCTECGEIISSIPKEIEKIDHTPGTPVQESKTAATCTTAGGYDEAIFCTKCGEELSRTHFTQQALGHNYGDWITVKEPTEDEEGLMQRVCKNDPSHIDSQVLPKKAKTVGTNLFQRIVQLLQTSNFFRTIFNWLYRIFHR